MHPCSSCFVFVDRRGQLRNSVIMRPCEARCSRLQIRCQQASLYALVIEIFQSLPPSHCVEPGDVMSCFHYYAFLAMWRVVIAGPRAAGSIEPYEEALQGLIRRDMCDAFTPDD